MPGDDPSSQRRKLKADLRKARAAAGLTQREAAERLAWSESKLIRIENGAVGLSVTDLQAMLKLYGVTNKQAVAHLTVAARGSRGSSWWSRYRDVVSPQFALYLGQEASASTIRVFHPFLVPGLLHTDEYAYELLRVHCTDEEARHIVDMRLQRQQHLLAHADSPELIFVLGEEALYRWIGGPAVMQRQLKHLLDLGGQPGISVAVIPFNAGAHPGLLGPFILLSFDDPAEDLLFVEGLSGDLVSRADEEKVDRFTKHFDVMRDHALSADRARTLIERLIENFGEAGDSNSAEAEQPRIEGLSTWIGDVSRSADAREDRWRSSGDDALSLRSRRPQARVRSLAYSPGPSATGAGPSASPRSSAAYFSSLSSASL